MSLSDQLAEAQTAYHQLMTGRSVVEVTDQNGEKLRYTAINASLLKLYINDLNAQLDTETCRPLRPMSVWGRG